MLVRATTVLLAMLAVSPAADAASWSSPLPLRAEVPIAVGNDGLLMTASGSGGAIMIQRRDAGGRTRGPKVRLTLPPDARFVAERESDAMLALAAGTVRPDGGGEVALTLAVGDEESRRSRVAWVRWVAGQNTAKLTWLTDMRVTGLQSVTRDQRTLLAWMRVGRSTTTFVRTASTARPVVTDSYRGSPTAQDSFPAASLLDSGHLVVLPDRTGVDARWPGRSRRIAAYGDDGGGGVAVGAGDDGTAAASWQASDGVLELVRARPHGEVMRQTLTREANGYVVPAAIVLRGHRFAVAYVDRADRVWARTGTAMGRLSPPIRLGILQAYSRPSAMLDARGDLYVAGQEGRTGDGTWIAHVRRGARVARVTRWTRRGYCSARLLASPDAKRIAVTDDCRSASYGLLAP